MAADFAAIDAAVRAVISGSQGTARVVPAGLVHPVDDADESPAAKKISTHKGHRFDVIVRDLGNNPSTPPKNHSVQITDVEVIVALWSPLRHPRRKLAARAVKRTDAQETANIIRHALEYPNNLTTGGGNPTGLVSGSLSATSMRIVREYVEEQVIQLELGFRGIVQETLPVA